MKAATIRIPKGKFTFGQFQEANPQFMALTLRKFLKERDRAKQIRKLQKSS